MAEEQDKSYRLLFSFPRMVEDLIRLFVDGRWVESLDFSTLEKVSERDVSPELIRREKDLLWRLRLRPRHVEQGPGDWFYVYLHLEFQSTADRFMAVRALTYRALLWEDLIRQQIFTASGKLPPVLTVVLYNGPGSWTAPTSVSDLIEPLPNSATSREVMEYQLIDAHGLSTEALADDSPVAGLFRMEQSTKTEDLLHEARRTARGLPGNDNQRLREALGTWIKHSALKRIAPAAQLTLRETDLTEVTSMLAERAAEWVEEWKQQGLEAGRREGHREGRREGRREGEVAVLLRQLTLKFGDLAPEVQERIQHADTELLMTWSERLLTAATMDEVFDGPVVS